MRKNNGKKRSGALILTAALCVLLMGACGKAQEGETSAPVAAEDKSAAPSVAQEESMQPEEGSGQSQETAPVAAEDESAASSAAQEESVQPEEESGQSQKTAPAAAEQENVPPENAADGSDETAVQEEQSEPIEAVIESVGENSFTARELYTEKLESGVMIMIDDNQNENRKIIEVTYTDQTVFTVRTTRNSGMEHRDSVGSSADLKEEVSVVLTGSRDGDIFRASEILIYNHQ